MLLRGDESTIIAPFEGFRERIQAEERAREQRSDDDLLEEKEKKSLPDIDVLSESDGYFGEERLGAHYRKHKAKVPPFTSEYITGNRYSPVDDEVSNALVEKYKESFAAKHFPFEYENPDNEIPEPRIYFEDGDDFNLETGSGEFNLYQPKGIYII